MKPETIKTTELVFEQYFATHAHFEIAGFYNDIQGLISQQIDPSSGTLSYANVGSVQSKGVDFELAGKWPGGLQGRLSYTVQESADQQSNSERITHVPCQDST